MGDIIVGINGIPCRDGTKTLLHNVKAVSEAGGKFIVLQCWRCIQLCSEKVPNDPLPIDRVLASEYIVQAYSLRRTNVFSDWEMWNFIEILLRHLQDELSPASSHDYSRMIKMEITDNSESCSESGSGKMHQNIFYFPTQITSVYLLPSGGFRQAKTKCDYRFGAKHFAGKRITLCFMYPNC